MKTVSQNQLPKSNGRSDGLSFDVLYKTCFPSVEYYVRKNNGTPDDARDVFQESVAVLLEKINQPDFVLTASPKTFLYAIAKNHWLKHLRDNRLVSMDEVPVADIAEDPNNLDPEYAPVAAEMKVHNWLQRVTVNCQRILAALFFQKESMESLMIKMGWKNKHTASNQKYKCIEQVRKEALKKSV